MDRDYPWGEVEQAIQDGLWEEAYMYYEFEADVMDVLTNLPVIDEKDRNARMD